MMLTFESCSTDIRARLMFAVLLMHSSGYLVEDLAMKVFMPQFGEAETDRWRWFCFVIGFCAAVCLPLASPLRESPCFLATRGDAGECRGALDHIAAVNGQ